ncbi:hypothetical protein LTR28_004080, partial [Elasticomyces elasticus]
DKVVVFVVGCEGDAGPVVDDGVLAAGELTEYGTADEELVVGERVDSVVGNAVPADRWLPIALLGAKLEVAELGTAVLAVRIETSAGGLGSKIVVNRVNIVVLLWGLLENSADVTEVAGDAAEDATAGAEVDAELSGL